MVDVRCLIELQTLRCPICLTYDLPSSIRPRGLSRPSRRFPIWSILVDDSALLVMKPKLVLKVAGLIGVLALISTGYCFWLMTVPLSYHWVPVVLIGFVVSIGVFVISLITSFILLTRLRRSPRAPNAPQIRPTS
jgi:hypothetical protein